VIAAYADFPMQQNAVEIVIERKLFLSQKIKAYLKATALHVTTCMSESKQREKKYGKQKCE